MSSWRRVACRWSCAGRIIARGRGVAGGCPSRQAGRMSDQVQATAPLKNVSGTDRTGEDHCARRDLGPVGAEAGGFRLLARKVRPGDPDNVEAEAARRYWPLPSARVSPQYRRRRSQRAPALWLPSFARRSRGPSRPPVYVRASGLRTRIARSDDPGRRSDGAVSPPRGSRNLSAGRRRSHRVDRKSKRSSRGSWSSICRRNTESVH